MKEVNYIMTTMTENSLIIIDEICRSTSLEEGTALAIATVEKLAQSSAFIYITTHYTLLTKLYDMYLNVKVWQMETIPSGDDPKRFKLDFKHSLIPGVTTVKRYGVYIVRNIWPDRILKYVDELLDKITKKPTNSKFEPLDEKMRLKYAIESKFRKLKFQNKLTLSEINKLINKYQNDLQKLGYPINIHSLSETDIFNSSIVQNFPRIGHSIFDNSHSLVDDDLHSVDERMKRNFTPTTFSQLESEANRSVQSIEFQQMEKRMNQIFTPDSSHQNDTLKSYQFSNNSYRNISQFLAENSENVNMLMPEVDIRSFNEDISDVSQNSSKYAQNGFGLLGSCIQPSPSSPEELRKPNVSSNQLQQNENKNEYSNCLHNSSIELSQDMNDFRFSLPLNKDLSKTSTPNAHLNLSKTYSTSTQVYENSANFTNSSSSQCLNNEVFNTNKSQLHHSHSNRSNSSVLKLEIDQKNISDIELESLKEDLEICSTIFINNDDFEEDIGSNCKSNTTKSKSENEKVNHLNESEYNRKNHYQYYLSPIVTVIQGLDNTTISIAEENESLHKFDENELENTNKIHIITNVSLNDIGKEKLVTNKTEFNILEETTDNGLNWSDESYEEHQDDRKFGSKENFNNEDINYSKTYNGININENNCVNRSVENNPTKKFEDIIDSLDNENIITQNEEIYDNGSKKISDHLDNTSKAKNKSDLLNEILDEPKILNPEDIYVETKNPKITVNKGQDELVEIEENNLHSSTIIHILNLSAESKQDNFEQTSIHSIIELSQTNNESNITGISSESKKRKLHQVISDSSQQSKDQIKRASQENEVNITSLSSASKRRNLDRNTPNSNSQDNPESSSSSIQGKNMQRANNEGNTTSISSASKKRNLDQITSDSSPSNQTNIGINFSLKSDISSIKESDSNESKRKKPKKKKFPTVRSTENSFKQDGSSETSTNSKSIKSKSVVKKKKFVPPRKLSAKEIREDFRQQDQKLLEESTNSSNFSKYLERLINRPSVEQIRNTTHLVYIRKSNEGVEVIPAEPGNRKKIKPPFKKHFSDENFNMSIFSDKNATPFENYLNSKEKDYKTFSFNFQEQNKINNETFQFMPVNQSIGDYTNNSVTNRFVRTNSELFKSQFEVGCSQKSENSTLIRQISENKLANELITSQKSCYENLTPDGFYKRNKEYITKIMNKYLLQGDSQETRHDIKKNIEKPPNNIFENFDITNDDLNI